MKAILAYVGIAYALSIALSLLIGLTGGHDSRRFGFAYLSMFLPAMAVVILFLTLKESPIIVWNRFPLSYVPVAVFMKPAVLHLAMLLTFVFVFGGWQWQDWLTSRSDGLYHAPPSRGWGIFTMQGLIGHIALNAVVGVAIVSFMAFFEEIGWRAWLLPRLRDRLGARRAVVLVAIIWALWHVPFKLSGILQIDGVSPVELSLVLPPGTMAAGLILGWLWLRTESIWLTAIAHGALNDWGQYTFKYMKDSGSPRADIIVLSSGSLALLALGTLLLCHCRSLGPSTSNAHWDE